MKKSYFSGDRRRRDGQAESRSRGNYFLEVRSTLRPDSTPRNPFVTPIRLSQLIWNLLCRNHLQIRHSREFRCS